ALERVTAQARERIDLNVMVVSPHGLVDVSERNISIKTVPYFWICWTIRRDINIFDRVLDDYLPMELLQTSVGSGA
ncbi:hypothetical protein TELCIR_24454, partial [Teladorsagia circumcincta]